MSAILTNAPIVLRPYQDTATANVHAAWLRVQAALLVMATGTGKTTVFAKVIQDRAHLGRALVLAHRGELLDQAARRIRRQTGLRCEIEKADMRAQLDGLYPPDVVVASVQSLLREKRRDRFAPFDFATIIVDEAHHAPAQSYRDILEHFSGAKVLGVTATPDRTDKTAMGLVFEEVAFVYDIRQAIDDGWLVPIRQKAVEVHGLDFSKVKTVAGDLNAEQLEKVLRDEEALHLVAQPTVELSEARKTMVFCVTVAHAHDMARVLRGYGVTAEALDGSSDERTRREVLGRFARGETRMLCNCMLLTEGFDEPSIGCIAVARPTKSRSLYAQMAGRGTRLHPGKADLLLLDFRGNAGKHVLVAPIDILEGNLDPKTKARAEQLAAGGAPVHEALDKAKIEAKQAAEKERERLAALEKSRLQAVARKRVREVDPFGEIGQRYTPSGAPGDDQEPTPGMIKRLKSLRVPIGKGKKEFALTKESAKRLVLLLEDRKKRGLATYPQAVTLKKFGMNPDVPFDVARKQLDALAANKWKRPEFGDGASVVRMREPGEEG